jgi:hypothetical protein
MAEDREYQRALRAAEGEVLVEVTPGINGELAATVTWGEWISDGIPRHGDSEGPMSVPAALRRADEVAELYGLQGVVVSVPDDDLWRSEWGALRTDRWSEGLVADEAVPLASDVGDGMMVDRRAD